MDLVSALEAPVEDDVVVSKIEALRVLHERKVTSLMRSIHSLKDQNKRLTARVCFHRR